MNFEEEKEKRIITLRLFDEEFVFTAGVEIVGICEEIRCEAKSLLDDIGNVAEEKILDAVADFLCLSLKRIVGDENVQKMRECCNMTVTETTGILCYALSEIRQLFSAEEDEDE